MKKILVVDDDQDILYVVTELLTSYGFDVHAHSTGNVSEIVKWNHPNLILLDICFFGKFGLEICKELKEKYTIPIILFSADIKQGSQFATYNADGFIQKPFDINQLVDTINRHLN